METARYINHLTITNRPANEYSQLCRFDVEQIRHGGIVVDSGSGVFQDLARYMRTIRPDITVINIDPSLAISPEDPAIDRKISLNDGTRRSAKEIQAERLAKVMPHTLPLPIEEVHIPESSVDEWVDLCGPANMFGDKREVIAYVKKITATLRPGGRLRIWPVINWINWDRYIMIRSEKNRLRFVSDSLGFLNQSGLSFEYYEAESESEPLRPALIGRKK